MAAVATYSLLSAALVSLVSLIGIATFWTSAERLPKIIFALVALAIGALLGDAFIHLLPQAFRTSDNTPLISLLVVGGIIVFFVLEKFLHWRHCNSHTHSHSHETAVIADRHPHTHGRTTGHMVIISDTIHNFVDGLVIGGSYFIGIGIGMATTIAILLHEIPQEMGDFGVLLHSGFSKREALVMNFLSALSAILGVLVALLVGGAASGLAIVIAPVAAGMFIYIASADLIPELHRTRTGRGAFIQIGGILAGVAMMFVLLLLE